MMNWEGVERSSYECHVLLWHLLEYLSGGIEERLRNLNQNS